MLKLNLNALYFFSLAAKVTIYFIKSILIVNTCIYLYYQKLSRQRFVFIFSSSSFIYERVVI